MVCVFGLLDCADLGSAREYVREGSAGLGVRLGCTVVVCLKEAAVVVYRGR